MCFWCHAAFWVCGLSAFFIEGMCFSSVFKWFGGKIGIEFEWCRGKIRGMFEGEIEGKWRNLKKWKKNLKNWGNWKKLKVIKEIKEIEKIEWCKGKIEEKENLSGVKVKLRECLKGKFRCLNGVGVKLREKRVWVV